MKTLSESIKLWQIDRLLAVVATMIFLPLFVHTIPWNGKIPLGAMWLPVFYAPLMAVIFCRPYVAITASFIAPMINKLLTGRPELLMSQVLTFELVLFSSVMVLLYNKNKNSCFIGAIAFIVSRVTSYIVLGVILMPQNYPLRNIPFVYYLPGILILIIINIVALKLKER